MKRFLSVIILMFFLVGCTNSDSSVQKALDLRQRLCESKQISFISNIDADYGDKIYSFSVKCVADNKGDLTFEVLTPDTISGIKGAISSSGGKLTFDDTALAFPLLAQGELSPVSAPWLLIKTLLGGYISSCGKDGDMLRITMDDSYENDSLTLDVWLDSSENPVRAEILWQGRRILSMTVENFQIL